MAAMVVVVVVAAEAGAVRDTLTAVAVVTAVARVAGHVSSGVCCGVVSVRRGRGISHES